MTIEQAFTPREIRDDWSRFNRSWIQFVDVATGEDSGKGLVELHGVQIPGRSRVWSSAELSWLEANGQSVTEQRAPEGTRPRFAPPWHHKGYTMINVPESRFLGVARTRFTWTSMVAARQYRYGLSERSFEVRNTSTVYRVGQLAGVLFYDMAALWKQGSIFVAPQDIDLSRGAALSQTIGVHPMVEGIGAICWNAKHCIGFYHDGKLLLENRSRPLATSIAHSGAVEYVETKVLADFYKSTILPRAVRGNSNEDIEGLLPPERVRSGTPVDYSSAIRAFRESERGVRVAPSGSRPRTASSPPRARRLSTTRRTRD